MGVKKLRYLSDGATNVKAFGAKGDQTGNDTIPIQAAIDAADIGATVIFPSGTYVVTSFTVVKSIRFYSMGGATIRFQDELAQRTLMFRMAANGIDVSFENLVFDGNKDNHTQPNSVNRCYYRILYWAFPENPYVSGKSSLTVCGCKFLNTPSHAIYLRAYDDADKADMNHALLYRIENNHFEKGYESAPRDVDTSMITLNNNCHGIIADNTFVKNEAVLRHGLGAIVISTGDTAVEVFSSVVIRNNLFHNYGRQNADAGIGPIGVVEFYASCDKLIIDGNRFFDSYYTPIKGKTNSRSCVITNNIIEGALINANSEVKQFGINIGRGSYFGIYDKYIISHNIIKNTFGNGITIVGSSSTVAPAPVGWIKDVIIVGNIVETIAEPGTESYGVHVRHYENATISNNTLKNNVRSIYCSNCKIGTIISNNELHNATKGFVIFQGYTAGEGGYTDYDADLVVTGNLMRTTLAMGNTGFWCQYYEKVNTISSTGNVARVAGAIPADYFIRTGSNVLGSVSEHHNVLQGSVSSLFLIGSGTLNQTQNLHNGTIIP